MTLREPTTTYLELRESTATGEQAAGLSHSSEGLLLLHVQEVASDGEPRGGLTVVHGAGDHGGRYLELGTALAEDGWAVALPDLRGHGRSEGERGHCSGIHEVVRDLEAVQDHLAYRLPDAPKVLLGQGLGAIWSLAYAAEKPGNLAALVLVAPLWSPVFDLPRPASGLKRLLRRVGPTTAGSTRLRAEDLTSDADGQRAWREDELTHDAITLRAGEQALAAAREYGSRVAGLGLPVLVLHGAEDPVSDCSASRALTGDAVDVRVLEGMRHDPLHERERAEAIDVLRQWLASAVPSA